jgi:hypothetical protein
MKSVETNEHNVNETLQIVLEGRKTPPEDDH